MVRGVLPVFAILAAWIVFLVLMTALWGAPWRGVALPDSDDYMRMVRIFDLIDGTAGTAHEQPRLGPGGRAEIGWSRLVDAPLFAVQAVLEKVTDRMSAAMATASVVSALTLLVFLSAAAWYARPFAGGAGGLPFLLLSLFFTWAPLRQFTPGRVDHHGWQAVLAVLAFGALARAFAAPEDRRYPAAAGLAFAAGLAVGADILPWLAVGAAFHGVFWLWRGPVYERSGLVFGVSVLGGALAFHAALTPPGEWLLMACDALSPVWLGFACAVPAFWGIVRLLPAALRRTPAARAATGVAVCAPLLAVLVLAFAECVRDPYGVADPLLRAAWLDMVAEAQSLPAYLASDPAAAQFFLLPLLAGLAASAAAFFSGKREDRALWAGMTLAAVCGLGLSLYQIRTVPIAQAVLLAPLAQGLRLLSGGARRAVSRLRPTRGQRLAGALLFFAACLAFTVFAVRSKTPDTAGAQAADAASCDLAKAAPALNGLPGPLVIAAHVDSGPELLFRTRHRVLSAPYHRNGDGILAVHRIFAAADEKEAHEKARAAGADVLILCPAERARWVRVSGTASPFAARLLDGEVPLWLAPVPDGGSGLKIYRRTE